MNILLLYPPTPETFWSFKHVLRFVSKRATFPPLGLLTVAAFLPTEWDLRLVDMNVEPLSDADLRWADYLMLSAMIVHKAAVSDLMERCRRLAKPIIAGGPLFSTGREAFPHMKRLYEPRHYYQRIRTFLERQKPCGPRRGLSWPDLEAFVKSLWLLGVWHHGRLAYWRLFLTALLRRPRQFPKAMELAIMGYHFRRVASAL